MNIESSPLMAGAVNCYDFAIVYARDFTNSNIENITLLQSQLDDAQLFYDAINYTCKQVALGTEELSLENYFTIQPNPSTGTFVIEYENQQGKFELSISDMAGRVVLSQVVLNSTSTAIHLKEEPGVYLVTILSEEGKTTKRLIIQ